MPRFSLIVPCFRVQGFLRECLDSVLEQSFRDIEVIAVDDRSPDGSGAILDEYAARDPRVRVLHLPENVGLGRARNAGLPYATGDYLLFLDSDDTLTAGALGAIADRLAEAGDPDVLVFDYARTYWWGGTRRNALAEQGEGRPRLPRPEPGLPPEVRRHLPADHPHQEGQQQEADRQPEVHQEDEPDQEQDGQRVAERGGQGGLDRLPDGIDLLGDDPVQPESDDSAGEQPAAPPADESTVVHLPNGETVTAANPQLAAVITAAVAGTPISEAFRQQGITIPPPGTAVPHPVEPAKVIPGDIGVLTDRHALALGNGKAVFNNQIQPIASVTGPSFLGWEHPPQPGARAAAEPSNQPTPTRPAVTAGPPAIGE